MEVVAVPLLLTVPFSVATAEVMPLAALVVTVGGFMKVTFEPLVMAVLGVAALPGMSFTPMVNVTVPWTSAIVIMRAAVKFG